MGGISVGHSFMFGYIIFPKGLESIGGEHSIELWYWMGDVCEVANQLLTWKGHFEHW